MRQKAASVVGKQQATNLKLSGCLPHESWSLALFQICCVGTSSTASGCDAGESETSLTNSFDLLNVSDSARHMAILRPQDASALLWEWERTNF